MCRTRHRKLRHKTAMSSGKQARRENAVAMAEEYSKLTVAEKIQKLDEKLGKGVGAVKQRKRLETAQRTKK